MNEHATADRYEACQRFVRWLDHQLLIQARGDESFELDVEPAGRFWLGRLAPEAKVEAEGSDDREQRLDPCAVGLRLRLDPETLPAPVTIRVTARCWHSERGSGVWAKSDLAEVTVSSVLEPAGGAGSVGEAELEAALAEANGRAGWSARVDVELAHTARGAECTISLVNSTAPTPAIPDPNLYEARLEVWGLQTIAYELEALPDSFRYDRSVPAYGINCGVEVLDGGFATADTVVTETPRAAYWGAAEEPPDLRFERLRADPLPPLRTLVAAYRRWGEHAWSEEVLQQRAAAESWRPEMLAEARQAAEEHRAELERIEQGVELLGTDAELLRAFCLMNHAMQHAAQGRYDGWRPFQIGFILSILYTTRRVDDDGHAELVWFATGGGKTETYLGVLVLAALYDRLTGKSTGVTAWTRFPLRMLSLQQTQRFADALAGAEIARQQAEIPGDPLSLGFFVGQNATPNAIDLDPPQAGGPDPDDPNMPEHYRVLLFCPFCQQQSLEMDFDRRHWRLAHICRTPDCTYAEQPLPFYVVDAEIYRFLPTVIVGTLDKAAAIAHQAAMRGLIGPPQGQCTQAGHGYSYASRSKHPNGCLVPGCQATQGPLPIEADRYGPTYRLQDELHLLRDSLGAVDAHYEALMDHLQEKLTGRRPHILASSATLSGHEKQVDVLYRRRSQVFPVQAPSADAGFWTQSTDRLQRRFVALAPRGVTLEFATDRTMTELQRQVRRLLHEPEVVCEEAAVDPALAAFLLEVYGVDVVYGNTIRDLEAVLRSVETQVQVNPLDTASLTGRTPFDEVRVTLDRLEQPEADFESRIHLIAASSMMSHGVDIDRLNVMAMLGVPLTTAEFIQSTARIGRNWPGLVHVLHKMARERDAGVYRSFPKFVEHGDRFVEPIPVTGRSRRVLERTISGLALARLLAIHEPAAGQALTTVRRLREYLEAGGIDPDHETRALVELLQADSDLDAALRDYVERWVEQFYRHAEQPSGSVRFPNELSPTGKPMTSLRDVESQAPVRD